MQQPPENKEQLDHIRHTLSHLLATVVLEKYPDAKIAIGPTIDNGFYYDIDAPNPITIGDLPKLEKRMRELIKQNLEMKQISIKSLEEAGPHLSDNPFKRELFEELKAKKEIPTFYKIGTFVDLCRGGHVDRTSEIDSSAFKLTKVAGAYWHGDSTKPMLQRIYGVAFEHKPALDAYLAMIAEAEKRDHRKIGDDLELFMFHPTAPGMPYWLPNGTTMYNALIDFWREEHRREHYQEIVSPMLNKKALYVTSGHFDHYWSDMFVAKMADDEEYGIKAMNCPNAMIVFGSKIRSYRDLPFRLSDTDTLHRYEPSGTLSGLLRVREFRQDDAHIYVSEDQIGDEYKRVFAIVERFYSIFNMSYAFRLGTRPKEFMGDKETWDRAEGILKTILSASDRPYTIAEGDGAFYGPKVDIVMRDALGREWQLGTVQLDFQQPRRFNLVYTDAHGKEQTPIAIHRVIYGSLERFIGILLEHLAGRLPTWLAPVQVQIMPVGSTHIDHCEKLAAELRDNGVRVHVDDSNETVGYKIRKAEKMKIPYMLVIGDKELASTKLQVRVRGVKEVVAMTKKKFLTQLALEISQRTLTPKP